MGWFPDPAEDIFQPMSSKIGCLLSLRSLGEGLSQLSAWRVLPEEGLAWLR